MQNRYKVLLVIGLILVIVGASVGGYGLWYNSSHYVSTDNARVVADLVQVGSVNAGRIAVMNVDVGSPVLEGQVIAAVDLPAIISRSNITDTTKVGFRDVQDQRADVIAPRSGVIAARWAKQGDTVPAGQRLVTLMDPRQVWIVANVDEGKIDKLRPGQAVEVNVDSHHLPLAGRVETVSPVTVGTLSTDGIAVTDFTAATQVVPVKIVLIEDHLSLIPGSSAKIKVRVR
jgi:multidrug resistance efflux pump